MAHGTWKTTGGGGFSLPIGSIIIGAAGAAVIYGAMLALAHLVADILNAAIFSGFVLLFAGIPLWLLARRSRRRREESPLAALKARIVPEPQRYELPGPEQPAIEPGVPREVHQHTHHHYGLDAA